MRRVLQKALAVLSTAVLLLAVNGAILSIHPDTRHVGLPMLCIGLCASLTIWVLRQL